MTQLTQKQVREIFSYDPLTGSCRYLITTSARGKKGNEIGSLISRGYRRVTLFKKGYAVHVLIWLWMTGSWPRTDIDHINGNRSDNRWANLRLATRSQNLMNQGKKSNNKSGYKGVISRGNSHSVQFRVNGKNMWLGSFKTAEAAARFYDQEVIKYQGLFAKANKSLGLI